MAVVPKLKVAGDGHGDGGRGTGDDSRRGAPLKSLLVTGRHNVVQRG